MLTTIKKNYKLLMLFLVILFALAAVAGIVHAGFPLTDDGNWMVIRFSAFYESLRAGQFPVRFLTRLNNGYGYPVADFLYPLFMYIGVPIHVLGFNFVDTIKLILASSLIFSSLFTYFWLKERFGNLASLTGATFYTLFPYHLFDVYKRGSVGEVLSLSILPFVLWQIEKENVLLTSLGIAFLILSHNTLALLFIPLIFVYILLKNTKLLKFSIVTMVLGFLISAFFWIPALYDTKYTVFGKTSVSNFYGYFIGSKGFGFGLLGIIFLVTLISGLLAIIIKKEIIHNRLFIWSFIFSLAISFFIFPVSKFIWSFIPFINLIQFPFRLISFIIVLLAFQVAFLVDLAKSKKKVFIAVIFLILIFVSSKPYLMPKEYQYLPDTFYSTNQGTTTVRNEYMPKWVKIIPQEMASVKVQSVEGAQKINIMDVTPDRTLFQVNLPYAQIVRVNTVYFPGWTAYANGVKTNIGHNNPEGLMDLRLKKGNNLVLVEFGETPVRGFADFLSFLGLAVLLVYYILLRKKTFKSFKL